MIISVLLGMRTLLGRGVFQTFFVPTNNTCLLACMHMYVHTVGDNLLDRGQQKARLTQTILRTSKVTAQYISYIFA